MSVLVALREISSVRRIQLVVDGDPVLITESVNAAYSSSLNDDFAIGVDVFGMTEFGDYVGIRRRDAFVVLHHHDGGDEEVLCNDAATFARVVQDCGVFRSPASRI